MLITSLDNDRIKSYIKLKDRKYRKKTTRCRKNAKCNDKTYKRYN